MTSDITAEQSLSLGDSHYVDENYEEAVNAYAAAISLLEQRQNGGQADTLHIRSLSHRSAAFYQLGRYEESFEDADQALKLCNQRQKTDNSGGVPQGLKPGETEIFHKRIGMASFQLKRYVVAKFSFISAKQLASLNKRDDKIKKEYEHYIDQCAKYIAEEKSESPTKKAAPAATTSPTATVTKTPTPTPTTTPTAAARVTTSTTDPEPTMPKYQYYQSDKVMTIAILERQVQPGDINVTFEKKRLVVILTKKNRNFTVIAGTLYSEVDVEKCKVVIKDEKVLIKLRKIDAFEWHELLSKKDEAKKSTVVAGAAAAGATTTLKKDDETKEVAENEKPAAQEQQQQQSSSTPVAPAVKKATPYASSKDWNAIEKELKEEEDKETGEGDEALNKLFQQIYGNANEDTRRAMIKSYQTSGGTVLSTNWDEVSKKDYEKERTAPKGCEWKTWEGDKLPMQDDD